MTDLNSVLPSFATAPYSHLLPSLDKSLVTTADLLTLDAGDIAKQAQLPPAEVTKLARAVLEALQRDLGVDRDAPENAHDPVKDDKSSPEWARRDVDTRAPDTLSTLDEGLDAALGGGIPVGYLTEVTGESGAGKTQLLLTLLLSVQLSPPDGLSRAAVYISTEAALSTSRLNQLLRQHPKLAKLTPDSKPSLSRVLSIQVPDLEAQEHILRYQLPVAISRQNVGLVVIDSIAANYRAEFEKPGDVSETNAPHTPLHERDRALERRGARSMAERRSQLIQLGAHLRDLARTHNIAIVVANQVADRFSPVGMTATASGAPAAESTAGQSSSPRLITPDPLTLDHQQRWFTGWGDLRDHASSLNLKTPALGLVWANQIAARIALVRGQRAGAEGRRRRWFRVVFACWCAPTEGRGVEYEIVPEGIRALKDVGGDADQGR